MHSESNAPRIPRWRPILTVGHVRCLIALGCVVFWVLIARAWLS